MSYLGVVQAVPRGPVPRIWHFGNVVLDERSLELLVGGQPVALERKQLEILIYLLQHAGEVVFKDRLADAVWPGRAVTDSNLTKCMAVLRQAIGDRHQSLIKTVHGYGYRVAAPVTIEAPAALAEPSLDEAAIALR